MLKTIISLSIVFLLVGCNNSSSKSIKSGVFLDSAVEGLNYKTATESGTTDENGTFLYKEGESVRFSIGNVVLGEVEADDVITPINLVKNGDINSKSVLNIARVLQSFDKDKNASNGIELLQEAKNLQTSLHVDFSDDTFIDDLINEVNSSVANITAVDRVEAKRHMVETLSLQNSSNRDFATVYIPSTPEELQAWVEQIKEDMDKRKAEIIATSSDELKKINTLYKKLSSDLAYNQSVAGLLMDRSENTTLQGAAYSAYLTIGSYISSLDLDEALMSVVGPALKKENHDAKYLRVLNTLSILSDFNDAQKEAYYTNLTELTNISLEFYQNATVNPVSKTLILPKEELACMSEEDKSTFSIDENGDFTYDGTDSSFYFQVVSSCASEETREKVYATYHSKAYEKNSLLIDDIIQKRYIDAITLGYETFADGRLTGNILDTKDKVWSFLDKFEEITDGSFDNLTFQVKNAQSNDTGIEPDIVRAWNYDRYMLDVMKEVGIEKPSTRVVFSADKTIKNMLYLVGKIFGITFVESKTTSYDVVNLGVKEYKVYETNSSEALGTLVIDMLKLPFGNNGGMNTKISKKEEINGTISLPTLFLRKGIFPKDGSKSYLTISEYISFAHELGHSIELMLNTSTNRSPDFGEIPSKFLENLVQKPTFLKALLSDDPDTPLETLPEKLILSWNYHHSTVQEISNFRFNLSYSAIIFKVSSWIPGESTDLGALSRQYYDKYYLPTSPFAQHHYDDFYLVNPGYDTYYYLYLLDEVIAFDLLSQFETSEDGIFDKKLGQKLRQYIFEQDNNTSEVNINKFLGREWNFDAFAEYFDALSEGY